MELLLYCTQPASCALLCLSAGPAFPPITAPGPPCCLPAHTPAGCLDIEDACRGFLDLAREAAAACVAVVFSDPAFADLFTRLYCTDDWRGGGVTGSVLATLEDFLLDFERMVQPAFYRRSVAGGLAWKCPLASCLAVASMSAHTASQLPQPHSHPSACLPACLACAVLRASPTTGWLRRCLMSAWLTTWLRC